MSTINEILDVKLQRNGATGAPFMTALVDFDMDGANSILSVSFEYDTFLGSSITSYAKNEDGEAMCFVLNVEGMLDGTLKHHYRGDSIAFDHASEIIAEYYRRSGNSANSLRKMHNKSTINEIIDIAVQRNGVSGAPFMTALVDFDIDGANVILSVSFPYVSNEQGELTGCAKNEQGEVVCFVLDVEGMLDGILGHEYSGDSIARDHVGEILAEYKRLDDLRWQQLGLIP
jgi:hypothetical protein